HSPTLTDSSFEPLPCAYWTHCRRAVSQIDPVGHSATFTQACPVHVSSLAHVSERGTQAALGPSTTSFVPAGQPSFSPGPTATPMFLPTCATWSWGMHIPVLSSISSPGRQVARTQRLVRMSNEDPRPQ